MSRIHNKVTKEWMNKYKLAKKYYEHYGDLNIPYNFKTKNGIDFDKDGVLLGIWIHTQRRVYKGTVMGKLLPEEIEMLDSIEMVWDVYDFNWNQMYELAKKYYEHYGNLDIPYEFKTTNGMDYDEFGSQLGKWIQIQRQSYKGNNSGKLIRQRIELLDNIKMIWDLFEYKWNKMYELAKKYYEHYGDLNIFQHFKTNNGIDYDAEGYPLGIWIQTQRQFYKGKGKGKLTIQKIKKLDEIEMIWYTSDRSKEESQEEIIDDSNNIRKRIEVLNRFYSLLNQYNESDLPDKETISQDFILNMTWMDKYKLAKKYYEHHGNLKIPYNFKTNNGIDYDAQGYPLGVWINNQRKIKNGIVTGHLTQKQIEMLDNIEMIWDLLEYNWNKMYELAKKYYEHYGNLNILRNFKTTNGIDYDLNGIMLGNWIGNQRQLYKGNRTGKLTFEQIEKLDSIEMIWDIFDYNWNKMYELAKKYYEHYGNLNIPQHFKTNNGIDYDQDGVLLGSWIHNLRFSYKGKNDRKISPLKIKKLDEIEMIWYTSDRKKEKSQKEIIDDSNNIRKQIEILNQFYSLLNQYNESDLPDKETINQDFMNQLNHKSLRLK